jgi:hypothetical protein
VHDEIDQVLSTLPALDDTGAQPAASDPAPVASAHEPTDAASGVADGLPADILDSLKAVPAPSGADPAERPDRKWTEGFDLDLPQDHRARIAPLDVVTEKAWREIRVRLGRAERAGNDIAQLFAMNDQVAALLIGILVKSWTRAEPLPLTYAAMLALPRTTVVALERTAADALKILMTGFGPSTDPASPTPPSADLSS